MNLSALRNALRTHPFRPFVIRVADGGEQYCVIILDDSTENVPVKAVHGPYAAR